MNASSDHIWSRLQEPNVDTGRQSCMTRLAFASMAAVLLLGACGSSGGSGAGDSSVPDANASSEQVTVVVSIDELTAGTWIPVAAGGQPLAPEADEQWTFFADGDGIAITGHDGCNGFGSSGSPDDPKPTLNEGVLTDLQISSTLVACDDIVYGPYPQEGDLLRLVSGGSELHVVGPNGDLRIELIRQGSDSTPLPPRSPPTDPPITDPNG